MSFFNDSGMITRGMGKNNRIITRGMAIRFDFGGLIRRRVREYSWGIFLPIAKENYQEVNIYSPLRVEKNREIPVISNLSKEVHGEIPLISNISKEIHREFEVLAKIDYNKLSRMIDIL